MNDIILKCNKCGYEKILGQKQISDLESKLGFLITNATDLNNSHIKLVHSKCGSVKITIVEDKTTEKELGGSESNKMIHCPFDGTIYKKGTLCPKFAEHKSITAHRGKRKANDIYTRHRGE